MGEGDRKTIILVDNSGGPSGAAKSLKNIVFGLHKSFRFVVVGKQKSLFKDLENLNVDLYELKFLEIGKTWKTLLYPFCLIVNTLKLLKIVRNYNQPIIHMNDCYNLCGIMVKFLNPSVRLIYHVRLMPDSYIKPLYKLYITLILKYSDKIICNSEAVRKGIRKSSKVIVIHNSLNHEAKDWELSPERLDRIVYLGNYMPGKGHIYALEVIKYLKHKGFCMPVYFYGSTYGNKRNEKYKEELIELARTYDLSQQAIFNDFCDDIKSVISKSHMVLNFSASESFGLVCLEAMWYGSLIVSLNSGGPADFILNGKSGILLEKGTTADKAAEIIMDISENSQKKKEIEEYALRYSRRNFSIKNKAKEFNQVYTSNE